MLTLTPLEAVGICAIVFLVAVAMVIGGLFLMPMPKQRDRWQLPPTEQPNPYPPGTDAHARYEGVKQAPKGSILSDRQ